MPYKNSWQTVLKKICFINFKPERKTTLHFATKESSVYFITITPLKNSFRKWKQWNDLSLNTFLNLNFHCEKKAESDSVLPSAWEYRPRSHAHDTLISVSVEYLNIPRWWNISLFYYRVSQKKSRLKKISGTGCPKKLLSQSDIWPDLTLTN